MKIVSISFVGYVDGYGYQDNLLPEYLQRAGHDVTVIASNNHYPSFVPPEQLQTIKAKGARYDLNNVHIVKLDVKALTSTYLFYCPDLYSTLEEINPDLIFHHVIDTYTLYQCVKYKKTHKRVTLFADNHADYINESQRFIWKHLVVRGVFKYAAKVLSKHVDKFWGVTQMRCDYLEDVFGVPKTKIGFLPIGGDSYSVSKYHPIRNVLNDTFGIKDTDILIVSGGKMGTGKGTVNLINAFKTINQPNIKMLLFGKVEDNETKKAIESTTNVYYKDWCNRQEIIEILLSSDIACWPIHHTTLIEDAVACCTPLILRKTGNTTHLIGNNNGLFVNYGDKDELITALLKLIDNIEYYKKNSADFANTFSYESIVNQMLAEV